MTKALPALEELFPCWDKLSPLQQKNVQRTAEASQMKKGERMYRGLEKCSGLFLVRSGQCRAFIISDTGKEITLYRLFPWDLCLFSASCLLKDIEFDIHIEAEKDSDIYIVPSDIYEQLMNSSIDIMAYTNKVMASRFSDVMWVMEQVLFSSFDSRLATFLLDQSRIDGNSILSITHEEIARHLGTAREVVSRMLTYFASEGSIALSRGKVHILNPQKLTILAS